MLTMFFFMLIILLGGVIMFDKIEFILRNKLLFLENDELIYKCLDKNILISTIACEILVNRNNLDTNLDDNILNKVINKLSIEQIWELMMKNNNSRLSILAYKKIDSILEFYQNNIDFFNKVNEDTHKIYYLK